MVVHEWETRRVVIGPLKLLFRHRYFYLFIATATSKKTHYSVEYRGEFRKHHGVFSEKRQSISLYQMADHKRVSLCHRPYLAQIRTRAQCMLWFWRQSTYHRHIQDHMDNTPTGCVHKDYLKARNFAHARLWCLQCGPQALSWG